MSVLDVFKEGREVVGAFRKLRDDIQKARPGGISPEEAAGIAEDFAKLACEVADLVGVSVSNKEELAHQIKALIRL